MLNTIFPLNLAQLYMNQYAQNYYGIVIYLCLAAALCALLASLAYIFSLSSVQDSEKRSEYECGFEPFDSATRLPFDVHFYLVGILFLIFDVEIALLFPWSLSLQSSGWFGFYLMLGFIFLLAVGFLYEWKRGALIWPSRQQKHQYITATNTNCTPFICASFSLFEFVVPFNFGLIVLRSSKTELPTSPYSNTKALLLLQAQRKIIAAAAVPNKLRKLKQLLVSRRTHTDFQGLAVITKTKLVTRNCKALLQGFVSRSLKVVHQCRSRNFTDERRISRVSKKLFASIEKTIRPFVALSTSSARAYKTLKVVRRRKSPLLGRVTRKEAGLRRQQLRATRLTSYAFVAPLLPLMDVTSYSNQFLLGFGVELLFTVLITAWLTYLALQLGTEKSKKVLALESISFFNFALSVIIICYFLQLLFGSGQFLFHGYFVVSVFTITLKILTAYVGRFILNNSRSYIETHSRHQLEYPTVMSMAILFMLLMVGSSHLISGFLSLVGFSLNLYVLILSDAKSTIAREAGVKYFYLSTFSSGLMLYGIFLIFLVVGTGQLQEIGLILATDNSIAANATRPLIVALAFLFSGLFFKLSAFPGHMWAAEVYEGASDPITAFFMLPTKVAVLAFVVHLLAAAFTPLVAIWQPMLTASAILSLVWGCVAAFGETKTKRFLAYASINQIGFLLLGLATASYEGYRAALFYLFIYAIMNLGFLTVFLNLRRPNRASLTYLTDFRGYAEYPRNSWSLSMILLSMAGIPPLAGFFGKYYLLLHAQEQTLYTLVFVGLVTSLVSTYYYLRLIKIMWFEKASATPRFHDLKAATGVQLQFFEWMLWAFIVFAGPIMAGFDIITTSLFTPVELNFALASTAFFVAVARPSSTRTPRALAVGFAHLVVLVAGFVSLVTVLVVVYHTLIISLSSWSYPFLYVLPAITIVLALGVTSLRQPTHSLLCLIAVFFSTVLLYLYVGAEFLAFLFLIVYVGAIAILFLFVIMLLHLKEAISKPSATLSGAAALFIPSALIVMFGLEDTLGYSLTEFFTVSDVLAVSTAADNTEAVLWFAASRFEDIRIFSDYLYTYHCVLFFIAALLLLTAMLGAIILATQATDKDEVEA